MWQKLIRNTLSLIQKGQIDVEEGYSRLAGLLTSELGFAEVDLGRSIRTGNPEVIFCQNKIDSDILQIALKLKESNQIILLTRARESTFNLLSENFKDVKFNNRSGAITIGQQQDGVGLVTVISAGTSDIPISEEAAVTANTMGARVQTFWDIGIAGIHRLFSKIELLKKSRVIIAVAGMDGALPGVVAGLVGCPVIAVPTSIGYGTGAGGYAALLTMLNSCAPGVSVVNIDNGFGAGVIAARINKIGENNCTS
jgi:pyridinium-3,5-biscarboxylic acid mononucleotide synthase